jgi:putative salt-induced outer membrane protein YdiY
VNLTDLAAADEPEDWYERDSRVDVNMTFNDGNTDSTNTLIFADTRLKLGDHRHLAELTFRRDETDNDRTKEQDLFRYSYNWLFNDPWYVGATADFERDPIKELDHRYTVGVLFGRDIFDDSRKFLTVSLGAGYSEEQIAGEDESGASGLWNLRYEHDFRNGDLTLFHDQNLNYQFYGVNNAILKTNTGFSFDIINDVYASISLRYDYETDPAEGAEKADTTLAIGVGAEF